MSSELDHVADLAAFVEASPSSHHAAAEGARRLAAEWLCRTEESAEWSLNLAAITCYATAH